MPWDDKWPDSNINTNMDLPVIFLSIGLHVHHGFSTLTLVNTVWPINVSRDQRPNQTVVSTTKCSTEICSTWKICVPHIHDGTRCGKNYTDNSRREWNICLTTAVCNTDITPLLSMTVCTISLTAQPRDTEHTTKGYWATFCSAVWQAGLCDNKWGQNLGTMLARLWWNQDKRSAVTMTVCG